MHPTTPPLRNRFTDQGLSTASGPKIVVMCYDRLDRDLAGAIEAIRLNDVPGAHTLLCHAQDLVHELRCMLSLDLWEHAGKLSSIYRYVYDVLVQANVRKDIGLVNEARGLLAELGDAFRQAATAATTMAAPVPTPTPAHASAPQPVGAAAGGSALRFSALA